MDDLLLYYVLSQPGMLDMRIYLDFPFLKDVSAVHNCYILSRLIGQKSK